MKSENFSESKKKVLVIGSGGREHALAWKLAQSPQVGQVIVAPGNEGMPEEWVRWPKDSGANGYLNWARRASDEGVDLVVVGPDNDLADGIVDVFEAHHIPVFGPTQAAAKIESSKAFAKEVMVAAGVPTASYQVACNFEEAEKVLKSVSWDQPGMGLVIKADGLALGKGVRICHSEKEALDAASDLIRLFSSSSKGQLVIEEKLEGEELSWMAFCDGESVSLLEPARDYKRLEDQDQGPNTGGMGAISPVPEISEDWAERVRNEVFLPTLKELKKRGIEFKGILYAGLMVNRETGKIWVLEFNSRFGDPEAQVLMSRLDGDLYSWCEAVAQGRLKEMGDRVPFSKDYSVVVVAASQGYPAAPERGKAVSKKANEQGPLESLPSGGKSLDSDSYFFAGVKTCDKGQLLTSGGRVFGAVGKGETLLEAKKQAYRRLKQIHFEGMIFRNDIGA